MRYDVNIANGITGVIKEHNITDLVLGLHAKTGVAESFIGRLTERLLVKCNTTTFVYKPVCSISKIKRHIIVVPANAEQVIGFYLWLSKILNILKNTGAQLVFYTNGYTAETIQSVFSKQSMKAEYKIFDDWSDFSTIAENIKTDDNLIIVLSRINKPSYNEYMAKIPEYMDKYFQSTNVILIYPMQIGVRDDKTIDLKNPSLSEPIEKLDEIGKNIIKMFKRNKN